MKNHFLDYRNRTPEAVRDIRSRLKKARSGQTVSFICNEDQVVKLLREITFHDSAIISRTTEDDKICITVRKT